MSTAKIPDVRIGRATAIGTVFEFDDAEALVKTLSRATGVQRLLGGHDRRGGWIEFVYATLMATMQTHGSLRAARYANGRVCAVGYTTTVCRSGRTNRTGHRVRLTTGVPLSGAAWHAVVHTHAASWVTRLYPDWVGDREPYLITACRLLSLEDAAAVLHPDLDTARTAWPVKLAKHSIANEEVQEAYVRYMANQIASI